MAIRNVTFNGKSTRDLGLIVESGDILSVAEPDIEVVEVPGRNGDLIRWNGRYNNKTVTYTFATRNGVKNKYTDWSNWLLGAPGQYYKLTDSITPDFQYEAYVGNGLDIETSLMRFGKFSVDFIRKPQKWYTSGMNFKTIYKDNKYTGSLNNPSNFASLPLIKASTNGDVDGTITVNLTWTNGEGSTESETITVITIKSTAKGNTVFIDSENHACWMPQSQSNSVVNASKFVEMTNGFPEFPVTPNSKHITIDIQNMLEVYVMPRWWTL